MGETDVLQHPRRNLGNRHRAQAERFVKLATRDPDNAAQNLGWAEQNARQAVLYDFTDERNWRCLATIKTTLEDEAGLHIVLEDLFVVLGRESERLDQLKGVELLSIGCELLEAAFLADPLDAEEWFRRKGESDLPGFSTRCKLLDFTDQRANIIYGRRLEQIRRAGHDDLFIDLVKHLLAHRPANHELWLELGRLHERRDETEQAWLCYDHVQSLRPHHTVRDEFLTRLLGRMDGKEKQPWSGPSVETRKEFLAKMIKLTPPSFAKDVVDDGDGEIFNQEELRLKALIAAGDGAEAFFLARSLVTSGEKWADEYLLQAKEML
ncbi:MAG: hypothetical protein ACKVJ7_06865 [Candidatus Poseidoniales archaeon]|jgi:hypothetical protein